MSGDDEREYDARGHFIGGPRQVNPSDLLARMIGFTHCREPAPEPREARRQRRVYAGREAVRQRFVAAMRAFRDRQQEP